jgi:UDP-glucose 6-dehydrogenase
MRVSIVGLRYPGTVIMACLARDAHQVGGVDVNANQVPALAAGSSSRTLWASWSSSA